MYLGEIHEVLEACIEMRLLPQTAYTPEVGMVNVRIHSEEPLEHGSHHVGEVWWKGNAILLWENSSIIHLHLARLFMNFAYGPCVWAPVWLTVAASCMVEVAEAAACLITRYTVPPTHLQKLRLTSASCWCEHRSQSAGEA